MAAEDRHNRNEAGVAGARADAPAATAGVAGGA
jgi:hypothetical protein